MWTLADKYNVLTPARAAEQAIKRLKRYQPYIFKKAVSRSSVYIHFRNLPNKLDHKLRVSDHAERDRYGYKWQLHIKGLGSIRRKDRCRYFSNVDALVENFIRYYDRVEKLNAELLNGGNYDEETQEASRPSLQAGADAREPQP